MSRWPANEVVSWGETIGGGTPPGTRRSRQFSSISSRGPGTKRGTCAIRQEHWRRAAPRLLYGYWINIYRARAYVAIRNVEGAVVAFEAALAREDAVPNFRTWAFHELPVLIATERMSARYDRAIQVLMKHKDWLTFPGQLYQWHGALALILHEQGQTLEAENEAKQALEAAKMTHSGFQHHPNLGLVGDTADEFGNRLRQIASKPRSGLRWWRK